MVSRAHGRTAGNIASWLVFGALVAVWWVQFAPTMVGGPTTYAIVHGHSMEPKLYTGDLVIARERDTYAQGDLVVFFADGGHVVHRLLEQNPDGRWQTQGDNNSWIDPWLVEPDDILGRYAYTVPSVGTAVTWAAENKWGLAGIVAAAAAIPYLPWRRKKIHPILAAALEEAEREPRREGRSGPEYGLLVTSGLATVLSAYSVSVLAGSREVTTSNTGYFAVATLVVSAALMMFFVYRLYDGRGVREPSKSLYALSGRLYTVPELPEVAEPEEVRSAVKLREIAEKYRLPVLHHIDHQTGIHEFLLVTVQRGSFIWRATPDPAASHDTRQPTHDRTPDRDREPVLVPPAPETVGLSDLLNDYGRPPSSPPAPGANDP